MDGFSHLLSFFEIPPAKGTIIKKGATVYRVVCFFKDNCIGNVSIPEVLREGRHRGIGFTTADRQGRVGSGSPYCVCGKKSPRPEREP